MNMKMLAAAALGCLSIPLGHAAQKDPPAAAPAASDLRGLPQTGSIRLLDAVKFAKTGVRLLGQARIINGKEAPAGKYPYQVALLAAEVGKNADAFFCAGSVYSSGWIVTAAHCVDRATKPEQVDILAGTQDLGTGGQRIKSAQIVVHPNYNSQTQDNDVALIKLASPLKQPPIAIIEPADAQSLIASGATVTASGWGVTKEGGAIAPKLREVSLPLVKPKDCNDPVSYKGAVTENMICAGWQQGGADSCQGDSGGPLSAIALKATVLLGVVSWGEGCARVDKYGVYTHVSRYRDWIAKTAK